MQCTTHEDTAAVVGETGSWLGLWQAGGLAHVGVWRPFSGKAMLRVDPVGLIGHRWQSLDPFQHPGPALALNCPGISQNCVTRPRSNVVNRSLTALTRRGALF